MKFAKVEHKVNRSSPAGPESTVTEVAWVNPSHIISLQEEGNSTKVHLSGNAWLFVHENILDLKKRLEECL